MSKLSAAAIQLGHSSGESEHSVVDSGNSITLWWGVRRSKRPARIRHPFGHGKELYFWFFVVAVSMFSVDGVVSVYEEIQRLLTILEAIVDPFEPPLPGKVKAEQALKFAESLAKGDPNRNKIALTVASDRVRELV